VTAKSLLFVCAAAVSMAQTTPPKAAPAARKPAAELPGYNELKYPELKPIEPPAISSYTLPNGMQLVLLENHELPLVNGTILVRTGSAFDPPEKFGLASITEQVLLEGDSLNRPAGEDLSRRLQNLGAEIAATVEHNVIDVSFSGLKENADAILDAVKDGLTAPEFPQDRVDLVKARLRASIARRNDDGAALVRRELQAMVFGKNSPYGAYLENANIDRINRGDLVDFYQRYFFPKNVMLALEGDFDAARMKGRIEALFEDWTSQQAPVPEIPQPTNTNAPGKFLAVKKDVVHSYFAVGQASGDYLDKDYPALEIMADILGGGSQGRLNQQLHGTVDNLAAVWAPGLHHPGLFTVSGTISNPFYTDKTLQTVYSELNKLRTEMVTEQELKTAKAAALNSLVFAFEDQFAILPRFAQYRFFHFPDDYTQQHQRALQEVTRADVLRVARERLNPAQMTTVVAGNPTGFEAPLDSLGGSVTAIDLTIAAPKPEAVFGDAVSQRRARQLLARGQESMGGADKLAAVTDYTSELLYQFDVSAGGTQTKMVERWLAPGYLRQDNTTATAKISVYCDGKIGWVANAQTSTGLGGIDLKQMKSDLFRVLFPLMLSDRTPGRKMNALDDRTVEISDASGEIVKVVFDPATGLLKNMLYDATTRNGMVSVLETYSEYRDIGGLKLPSKVSVSLAGKKYQEVTVQSIRMNTGLKVEDLEKRP
jgi:zinc protease